jgi:hypothetical protein
MLNTHASPAPDLFRAFVFGDRSVDRLGVMPSTAVLGAQPEPLTAQAAVARLVAAGLVCRDVSAPRLHILGGIAELVEDGISGYEGPFAILAKQNGTLTAVVAGTRRAPNEETSIETLADAVAFVLRVYRARGVLPGLEASR